MMGLTDANKAGVALFVGVVQFAIFEMIAEFVYPGYSVSANYISDLGPPCSNGTACASSTSWVIFDTSIMVLGIFLVVSAYLFYRYFKWKPFASLILIAGIAAIGVGIFDETAPFMLHSIFSFITFIAIGLSAILSYRMQKPPLGYFAVFLGLVTLVALVLYVPDHGVSMGDSLGIGKGGLERMIVYPVLLWSLAFGGHLMAMD
jgi:hypothetical membrane protein